MNVVFFGASKFVVPLLDTLRTNFHLALIVTTETNATEPVSEYAKLHSIRLLSIKKFDRETMKTISTVNAPVGVLAYFGIILPETVLNIFPHGIINIHPSLLPKFRGPTPGQSAILSGETQTGITLIKLDKQVDHGPILAQMTDSILPTDNAESLYIQLFRRGAEMLNVILNKYVKGEAQLISQDDSKASFTDQLTRESGYFDSNNPPDAKRLDRLIRAYYPWPGVWTKVTIKNKAVRIKFLPNKMLHVEGKNPMSYKDFMNGYPEGKAILEKMSR